MHTQTRVYICAQRHTILIQVDGTHGCTLSKQTHRLRRKNRETREHTHTETHPHTPTNPCHPLFYLLPINQISAYFGNVAPSRERSVLGAHCREPHCQPTAPTLMTSSLCTIHQSKICRTLMASAVRNKDVTLWHVAPIKNTAKTDCSNSQYHVSLLFLDHYDGFRFHPVQNHDWVWVAKWLNIQFCNTLYLLNNSYQGKVCRRYSMGHM